MSILRINQNIIALNANRNLRVTGSAIAKSLERLSSGLRINRAADDAAGLSISENLRAQIRGLNRAAQNALDGISLIQTAEGALNETSAILQRIRELAVQSANGALTANDRIGIQVEVDQLVDEIDRIAKSTEFNTKKLLDGSLGALISTDDPTQLRAAVVGNVGKGGNFTIQLDTIDSGRLQVQKTDVFVTIQQTDAVGSVNFLDTITLDATFTPATGQVYGNTGVLQISPTPNSAGAVAVGNGTATVTITDLSDAGTGVGVTINSLVQAYEVSNNVDTITFSFVNNAGSIIQSTTTISTSWSLDDLFSVISGNASVAAGAAVTFGIANGIVSIGGAGFNRGAPMALVFNDVDGSGSQLNVSINSGRTNQFFDAISGRVQNLGGTETFTINGGEVRQIGAAGTTGTFDVRFDVVGTRDLVSVAFTFPSGSTFGASGLVSAIAFADPIGSVAAGASPLTFTITALGVALGGDTFADSIQANGVTTGDTLTVIFEAGAGAQSATVTLDSTFTFTALAAAIETEMENILGAGEVDVNITASGEISIANQFGGSTLLNSFVGVFFTDADGTGSEFFISAATINAGAGVGELITNPFNDDASYSVVNTNGAFVTGTIQGGGNLFSIGDTTVGGFYGRLDVETDATNIGALDTLSFTRYGVVGQSDQVATSFSTDGNQFQEFQLVRQVSTPSSNSTIYMSAITNRTYALFTFNNQAYSSIATAGGTREQAIAAAIASSRIADSLGRTVFSVGATVNYGGNLINDLQGIEIAFSGFLTMGETGTFNISTNNVLTADQQNTLASINRFQDFGVFQGRANLQFTVYIKGQGGATVNVSSNDTLEDLAGKISLAIANPGVITDLNAESTIDFFQTPDLVHVNTVGLAKGTISITTPIPGLELVFSGDEDFLSALSLIEIQEAQSPIYSVAAYNIETGALINTQRVNTGKVSGLLGGLDIFLDTAGGIKIDPDPPAANTNLTTGNSPYFLANERPVLSLSGVAKQLFMHVAPRDFILQIGANQGQRIRTFIGDLSAEALGINGLLIVNEDLSQEAITVIDQAIGRVSAERGRLGAIQNRLESTIRNLETASENLISSESRIRDVDVAQETLISTRNQILLQAGIAALAQANQLPQAVLQLLR